MTLVQKAATGEVSRFSINRIALQLTLQQLHDVTEGR
jgi:hypothetical protein